MAEPQVGYWIGDDDAPNVYELIKEVKPDGGEGVVWQAATSQLTGIDDHLWAVKIIHTRHVPHSGDVTPNASLRQWLDRLRESHHQTTQLQDDIPGIVGAARIFHGEAPHPRGESVSERCLYVVSSWIKGEDLGKWRAKHSPSFSAICDVLGQLASIVDAMANHEYPAVHRDISPDNVMIKPDGRVRLIDFTFIRPPNTAANTQTLHKRGYSAPEMATGHSDLPADRYSFGAVAFYLLAGAEPAVTDAAAECHAVLLRNGFDAELAGHVAALLAADPAQRPTSLVDWVTGLRALGQQESAPRTYRAAALTVDGTATPVIIAGGVDGVAGGRLGAGMAWRLRRDAGGPSAVTALATVTDGSGTLVSFAVNDGGSVLVGRSGGWSAQVQVVSGSGLAATRDSCGRAVAHVVGRDTHELTTITVGLDGDTTVYATGRVVRRVLTATADRDGSAALFVLAVDGGLACVGAEGVGRIDKGGALDVAACLDHWGELRCYKITAGNSALRCFDRSTGVWAPADEVEAPVVPSAVACAGHRNGVTVALAGQDGLYLADHDDHGFGPWRRLSDQPSSSLSLTTGSAWRLWLGGLVAGRAVVACEDFNGGWSMGLTAL